MLAVAELEIHFGVYNMLDQMMHNFQPNFHGQFGVEMFRQFLHDLNANNNNPELPNLMKVGKYKIMSVNLTRRVV